MKKPDPHKALLILEENLIEVQNKLDDLQEVLKKTQHSYISRSDFVAFFRFSVMIMVLGTLCNGFVILIIAALMRTI